MKSFSFHACVAWFKQEPLKNLARIFLAISIVCFPFQIRTLLFSPDLFVSGNFNPFTAVFLSLNNLIVLVAGVLYGVWLLRKRLFLKKNSQDFFWWWGLFFATVTVVSLVALDSQIHWQIAMHWMIIFIWFLLLSSDLLSWRVKFQCFIGAMFFESALGMAQFVLQSSIGLGKLGEPVMNPQVPGIAKIDWQNAKFIRPYGTFPHTNVLAGAIVFALFAAMNVFQKSLRSIMLFTLFFGTALILTFSRSAWLGFLIALILSFVFTRVKHRLVIFGSIFLVIAGVLFTQIQGPVVNRILGSDGQSSVERELYMNISKNMFLEHPFGVGLGNFTLQMTNFTQQKLAPWVIQPVHNVYMLIANELGILGLLLILLLVGNFFYLVWKEIMESPKPGVLDLQRNNVSSHEKTALKPHVKAVHAEKRDGLNFSSTSLKIALLATFLSISLFDHYFFTLEQGQFLFIFLMAYICYTGKNEALPRMKS